MYADIRSPFKRPLFKTYTLYIFTIHIHFHNIFKIHFLRSSTSLQYYREKGVLQNWISVALKIEEFLCIS